MKWVQRILIAVAALSFFVLLRKIRFEQIWSHLSQVGWGMALILAQEIVAHCANTLGWRYAFTPSQAGRQPLGGLLRLRIAGDGINYLTPSGTIAGEFLRAQWLPHHHSTEERYSSVAVAKFSQALGQALFILLGLALVVGPLPLSQEGKPLFRYAPWVLMAVLSAVAAGALWARRRGRRPPARATRRPQAQKPVSPWSSLGAVPQQCLNFLYAHPARFLLSTFCFMFGFAWGTFEAYWICRFLGAPVSPTTAMAIEVLSQLFDMMFFMVPAKIGTQETGKTVVFAALGLKPSVGFAFGIVRHIRELSWAGLGLMLCSLRYKSPGRADPLQHDPESLRQVAHARTCERQ
ncbi:MAG: flippase-like domain-containing protein [Elusimicrobia bacterium]|nr:flippase-like domain-containing protein [Elusimicrobiota bacterium]